MNSPKLAIFSLDKTIKDEWSREWHEWDGDIPDFTCPVPLESILQEPQPTLVSPTVSGTAPDWPDVMGGAPRTLHSLPRTAGRSVSQNGTSRRFLIRDPQHRYAVLIGGTVAGQPVDRVERWTHDWRDATPCDLDTALRLIDELENEDVWSGLALVPVRGGRPLGGDRAATPMWGADYAQRITNALRAAHDPHGRGSYVAFCDRLDRQSNPV